MREQAYHHQRSAIWQRCFWSMYWQVGNLLFNWISIISGCRQHCHVLINRPWTASHLKQIVWIRLRWQSFNLITCWQCNCIGEIPLTPEPPDPMMASVKFLSKRKLPCTFCGFNGEQGKNCLQMPVYCNPPPHTHRQVSPRWRKITRFSWFNLMGTSGRNVGS